MVPDNLGRHGLGACSTDTDLLAARSPIAHYYAGGETCLARD
jgi:hypothetical protein